MRQSKQALTDDYYDRSAADADLAWRSEQFLNLLIEHHGNDNATGERADIPPKIQAALDARERWRKTK